MALATAPTRHATPYQTEPPTAASIAGYQRHIAELEGAAQQLSAAYTQARAERDEARDERDEARAALAARDERLTYVSKVHRIGNDKLGAGQRLTLMALHHELERKKHRITADGWTPVYLPNIAGACGQSTQSVSSHLTYLATCGAIERKTDEVTSANGTRRNQVYVKARPALYEPDELRAPEPRKHGGRQCRKCGTESMTLVSRTYQCRKCGRTQVEAAKPTTARQVDSRLEDTPAEDDPAEAAAFETATGNEVDMSLITNEGGGNSYHSSS